MPDEPSALEDPEEVLAPTGVVSAADVPDDSRSFALVAAAFPFDDRLSVR